MISKPKYFQIYLDCEDTVNILSDAERGRLFSLLFRFAKDGEVPDLSGDPALAIAFSMLSRQIARDYENYNQKCERNRANAKKGGAPKGNSNACKNNRTVEKTTETTQEEEKEEEEEKEKKEEKKKWHGFPSKCSYDIRELDKIDTLDFIT